MTKYLSHHSTRSIIDWCADINYIFMLFYWKRWVGTKISKNLTLLHLLLTWEFSPVLPLNIVPSWHPPCRILLQVHYHHKSSIFYLSSSHHAFQPQHLFLQCKPIYFSPLLQIILNNALRVEAVWMGMIYYKERSLCFGLHSSAV